MLRNEGNEWKTFKSSDKNIDNLSTLKDIFSDDKLKSNEIYYLAIELLEEEKKVPEHLKYKTTMDC